ncbi:M48 family metalloprotease [Streptomyces goshikiensis]|uniref:M48 family metalloprotease n=1 Tax=Streptomyces goshikiensis TaxID=1942 RepID=UPI003658AA5A
MHPTPHPDDLVRRHAPGTRVTYRARQRSVDATAWLRLALHLPAFLLSLGLVLALSVLLDAWLGLPVWLPAPLWLASGALVFNRTVEDRLARHLLRLHRPLPHELAALAPVWREVTARAGVDGSRYQLWIEDSGDLNAFAAAGHLVGVTRYAVENLSPAQLAAVLAHELGHHTGGHAWTALLARWYALPARAAWQLAVRLRPRIARGLSYGATVALTAAACWCAYLTLAATYGLPLLLLALPWLTAAVARRGELRADAHAAALGFGPTLATLLEQVMAEEEEQERSAGASAAAPRGTGPFARLLSSHPDHRTRLHHLQPYLRPAR